MIIEVTTVWAVVYRFVKDDLKAFQEMKSLREVRFPCLSATDCSMLHELFPELVIASLVYHLVNALLLNPSHLL